MPEPVWDEDKSSWAGAAAIASIATADGDATYGQPEADLLNECKAKLNLMLAALRNIGALAQD